MNPSTVPGYTALSRDVPTVTAVDLVTCGSRQIVVTCPRCTAQHRHLGLGLRRSPCGQFYVITAPPAPVQKLTAAA